MDREFEDKTSLDIETNKHPNVDTSHGIVLRLDPHGDPVVPASTSDSMDPLNWTTARQYTIIGIVCFSYFLLTYLTTTPIPSFSLLEVQFDASYSEVNWTFAISALGLVFGPLFTTTLGDTYGRRPVLMVSTAIALVASGCTGIKTSNIGAYMAARFFQGFGAGPAANIGLSIINDISFEHQRGLRIGLWAAAANVGTVFGGIIGGFLATASQYWVAYHVAILYAALLVVEFFFLPETLYPRALVVEAEREKTEICADVEYINEATSIKRTKQLGRINVRKVPGVPHSKPWDTLINFGKIWAYPTIVLSVLSYLLAQYWWVVTVMTMIPSAYEEYEIQIQGLFFVGPFIGVVFAEIFCSGRLSDSIVTRLSKKNGGQRTPEMRLWLGYPGAVLSTIGLIVWGVSVEKSWHWMVGQVALFLFMVGLQTGNTVLSAYIVDNYPMHANSVITYYSVLVNLSAFIAPWFIGPWVDGVGYAWCFGTQGIICTACLVPVYVLLHKFGPRLRKPMILGDVKGDPVT